MPIQNKTYEEQLIAPNGKKFVATSYSLDEVRAFLVGQAVYYKCFQIKKWWQFWIKPFPKWAIEEYKREVKNEILF